MSDGVILKSSMNGEEVYPITRAEHVTYYNSDVSSALSNIDSSIFNINSQFTNINKQLEENQKAIEEFKEEIKNQPDNKAQTYYGSDDPSEDWTTDEVRESHIGDMWYDTNENTTKIWIKVSDSNYSWKGSSIPDSVFDKIDGKAKIFIAKPENGSTINEITYSTIKYNKGDMWIVGGDYQPRIEPNSSTNTSRYAVNTFLIAVNDSSVIKHPTDENNNTYYQYSDSDWTRKDIYADKTDLDNVSTNLNNVDGKVDEVSTNLNAVSNKVDVSLAAFTQELKRIDAAVKKQSDGYALTYVSANDPAWGANGIEGDADDWQNDPEGEKDASTEYKSDHVGDMWQKLKEDGSGTENTYIYIYDTLAKEFKWLEYGIPNDLFNQIQNSARVWIGVQDINTFRYATGDLWFIDELALKMIDTNNKSADSFSANTILVAVKDVSVEGAKLLFSWDDWKNKLKYSTESDFDNFASEYKNQLEAIKTQVDGKAQIWYQATNPEYGIDGIEGNTDDWQKDPDDGNKDASTEYKSDHVGDIWFDTDTNVISIYIEKNVDNIKSYEWVVDNGIPEDFRDRVDGKSSIYVEFPLKYEANDYWITDSSYDVSTLTKGKDKRNISEKTWLKALDSSVWTNKDGAMNDASFWADWEIVADYPIRTEFDEFTKYYEDFLNAIDEQVDKKSSIWRQDNDPQLPRYDSSKNFIAGFYEYDNPDNPSSGIKDGTDKRDMHLGDIWFDTSTANEGKVITKIYVKRSDDDYEWEVDNYVPTELQDIVDGKCSFYPRFEFIATGSDDPSTRSDDPSTHRTININDFVFADRDVSTSESKYKKGDILRCTSTYDSSSYNYKDSTSLNKCINERWELQTSYVDSSTLDDFRNILDQFKEEVQSQVDGRAQVYRQEDDPATNWTTDENKSNHVGDIWFNTSTGKTAIYGKNADGKYAWNWQYIIPDELLDKADGLCQIFYEKPANGSIYYANDLWINYEDIKDKEGNILFKANTIYVADSSNYYIDNNAFEADHWEEKLQIVDTSTFTAEFNNFSDDINEQLDKKADVWKFEDDPTFKYTYDEDGNIIKSISRPWIDEKDVTGDPSIDSSADSNHVCDLWINTETNMTYIFGFDANGEPYWQRYDLPDAIEQKINNKAKIWMPDSQEDEPFKSNIIASDGDMIIPTEDFDASFIVDRTHEPIISLETDAMYRWNSESDGYDKFIKWEKWVFETTEIAFNNFFCWYPTGYLNSNYNEYIHLWIEENDEAYDPNTTENGYDKAVYIPWADDTYNNADPSTKIKIDESHQGDIFMCYDYSGEEPTVKVYIYDHDFENDETLGCWSIDLNADEKVKSYLFIVANGGHIDSSAKIWFRYNQYNLPIFNIDEPKVQDGDILVMLSGADANVQFKHDYTENVEFEFIKDKLYIWNSKSDKDVKWIPADYTNDNTVNEFKRNLSDGNIITVQEKAEYVRKINQITSRGDSSIFSPYMAEITFESIPAVIDINCNSSYIDVSQYSGTWSGAFTNDTVVIDDTRALEFIQVNTDASGVGIYDTNITINMASGTCLNNYDTSDNSLLAESITLHNSSNNDEATYMYIKRYTDIVQKDYTWLKVDMSPNIFNNKNTGKKRVWDYQDVSGAPYKKDDLAIYVDENLDTSLYIAMYDAKYNESGEYVFDEDDWTDERYDDSINDDFKAFITNLYFSEYTGPLTLKISSVAPTSGLNDYDMWFPTDYSLDWWNNTENTKDIELPKGFNENENENWWDTYPHTGLVWRKMTNADGVEESKWRFPKDKSGNIINIPLEIFNIEGSSNKLYFNYRIPTGTKIYPGDIICGDDFDANGNVRIKIATSYSTDKSSTNPLILDKVSWYYCNCLKSNSQNQNTLYTGPCPTDPCVGELWCDKDIDISTNVFLTNKHQLRYDYENNEIIIPNPKYNVNKDQNRGVKLIIKPLYENFKIDVDIPEESRSDIIVEANVKYKNVSTNELDSSCNDVNINSYNTGFWDASVRIDYGEYKISSFAINNADCSTNNTSSYYAYICKTFSEAWDVSNGGNKNPDLRLAFNKHSLLDPSENKLNYTTFTGSFHDTYYKLISEGRQENAKKLSDLLNNLMKLLIVNQNDKNAEIFNVGSIFDNENTWRVCKGNIDESYNHQQEIDKAFKAYLDYENQWNTDIAYLKNIFDYNVDVNGATISNLLAVTDDVNSDDPKIVAGIYGGGNEQLNENGFVIPATIDENGETIDSSKTLMIFAGAEDIDKVSDSAFKVYNDGTMISENGSLTIKRDGKPVVALLPDYRYDAEYNQLKNASTAAKTDRYVVFMAGIPENPKVYALEHTSTVAANDNNDNNEHSSIPQYIYTANNYNDITLKNYTNINDVYVYDTSSQSYVQNDFNYMLKCYDSSANSENVDVTYTEANRDTKIIANYNGVEYTYVQCNQVATINEELIETVVEDENTETEPVQPSPEKNNKDFGVTKIFSDGEIQTRKLTARDGDFTGTIHADGEFSGTLRVNDNNSYIKGAAISYSNITLNGHNRLQIYSTDDAESGTSKPLVYIAPNLTISGKERTYYIDSVSIYKQNKGKHNLTWTNKVELGSISVDPGDKIKFPAFEINATTYQPRHENGESSKPRAAIYIQYPNGTIDNILGNIAKNENDGSTLIEIPAIPKTEYSAYHGSQRKWKYSKDSSNITYSGAVSGIAKIFMETSVWLDNPQHLGTDKASCTLNWTPNIDSKYIIVGQENSSTNTQSPAFSIVIGTNGIIITTSSGHIIQTTSGRIELLSADGSSGLCISDEGVKINQNGTGWKLAAVAE